MIHRYLKNQAATQFPDLEWSINFYNGKADAGTVYTEGGGLPDTYDFEWRYPEYMILIRSKDWDKAEQIAQGVLKLFHKKSNLIVFEKGMFYEFDKEIDNTVIEDGQAFYVQSIFATSEVLRLGVSEDGKMEYTVNLRAKIREENNDGN